MKYEKQVFAQYDSRCIRVYQAYKPAIAEEAVCLQRFGKAFNVNRMTWIKPSFLWMMYRSNWGTKKDQACILAIDVYRETFERLLAKAVGLKEATIGIELNKPDAIEHLKALVGEAGDVHIEGLKTRYPQGAEKQLIQMITGRQVPPGKLPADVQCVVCNVATAAAVYDAVTEGKPLTRRGVTLTGGAMAEPMNVMAPAGNPVSHLIKMAGRF